MSASSAPPIEVFISYSHKDKALRDKLGKHLSILKRQRVIDEWHDRRIGAGQEWAGAIDDHLNRASVILLLVSADFLASDYCYDLEMTRALQRHDAGDARVIPVILRSVDWQGAPFAKLQALPRDGRPVTSWSNKDDAFTEVARGIREALGDLPARLVGPSPPGAGAAGESRSQRLPAIWNVPLLRNPNFTGRDELLDELHKKLTDGRVALTAVHGMGGVGKTQLALEYAYAHAGEFDLVWWLRSEEPATLLEDYAALAEPLGLAEAREGDLPAVAEAVGQALSRRDRWLLVFDNATRPDDLTTLLPRPGGGRVLITSRNPSWPFALPLDVPVLSRDAAIGFLLDQTRQDDRNAADALANELGDLPLALAQAVAYMSETGVGIADYVDLFRNRRQELWAQQTRPADYPATVGTTMAIDRLRTKEPLAVDLLSLCAFLAPEAIPRRLLSEHHKALPDKVGAAVSEPLRLNRLVAALQRYSLVEATPDGLSFHRLVQAARDALELGGRHRWVAAVVALMSAAFPYRRDDPTTWAPSGALLAHALAAAGHSEEPAGDLEGARWLLKQTARYLDTRAEFARAKVGHARALELAEAAFGPEHPEVAPYVNNLGSVLQALGDLGGARAAFERALQIGERTLGPDHPNIAIRVNGLGLVLQEAGDLAGARAAFERALRIDEKNFGPEHPNIARYLNNLGSVLQALGDLGGARAAFERALAIDERSSGPDHPNAAIDVNNLGLVLRALGDLPNARAAFERALRIDEASLGPNHPKVAIRLNNLVSVLGDMGDPAGARAAVERALRIFETFLPSDHPNIATARETMRILAEQERSASRG